MACADEYSYHSVSIELKDTATNTLIFDYYDYTYSDYTHEFRFCLREERSYLMSMDFGNSYNDVVCNIRDENNEVKRTFSFREDYNGTFAIY